MTNKFVWTKKDLLGLEYLTAEELSHILETAEGFKEVSTRDIKKVPALRGKTAANLFYEPSTRTRVSFEIAEKRLSCDVVNMDMKASSVLKGETLADTGRNLEALKIDIFVIRHHMAGAPNVLSQFVNASVVNAGDGKHEHPTQALLDIYTLKEKFGSLKGLNVSIIGDISHSRVARSNIWGLTKLGANVTLCAPEIILPHDFKQFGVKITSDLDEALKDAHAINVLRMQFERDNAAAFPSPSQYYKQYGITKDRLKKHKKDIIVMHPGPINRGIEISSDVADGPNSVILDQVTNGIAVRMAVLYLVSTAKRG
ncbi:Aspartate carbamoyltransferase [Elusimicrobium minutum Pei191]|uniref:Aspartate carbamoyltransferase n=1 Tax=Elusimicrobium minutum (strain Pei191) TaxID=445932 RepID=B2KCN4_ELUMP|nr:aspartate carbamoyltransferase catalytic subunit [Elusimicrobium minutum]ACC98280.1 Aspartate carbamoyltransferase [Elusimicrobium minutum Pei191]